MDKETKKEFEKLAIMVNGGFEEVGKKFEAVDEKFEAVDKKFEEVNKNIDTKLRKTELKLMEHTEEQIGNLKGDLVVLMRKEDKKVNALIEILQENNVLGDDDVQKLMQLEPFARAEV